MAPPDPPPSRPSWVILSTLPLVGLLDSPTDVSLAPLEASRVTLLTLSPRVFTSEVDPCATLKLPYLYATDPSGLILAITPPPTSPPPSSDESDESDVRLTDIPGPQYLVLDVAAATATTVPDHPCVGVFNWVSFGVIAAPAGAPGFMIANLGYQVGDEPVLTCFSSQTGKWIDKYVDISMPRCSWNFEAVISHDAKRWWVDPELGVLACDPFAEEPEMDFVPLPEDDDPASHRYVQISNGKFRCVDVTRARQNQGGAPTVTMHTPADPEADAAEWKLEYKVRFDEIWDDETYWASGLPVRAPVLALIHPENPDVLYFFVMEHLVGVDMRARKVECQACKVAKDAVSPSDVLALVLPSALTAGF